MNTKQTLGSTLPLHLSGASPLSYYCGNMVWQNIVETGKKMFEHNSQQSFSTVEPMTILNNTQSGYSELHQVAFVEGRDQRMVIENASFENLNARDNNGNTPIMWAASQGNEQLVELLTDQGAAVNMQNFVGETALYIAAARGFDRICTFLIENGADTRFSTVDGTSPLHIASAEGHMEVVKTLLSRGAFVNASDDEGDTPLHFAVREGRKEVVEFLVKQFGADFGFKNEDLETPFDLAVEMEENDIVAFLSKCDSKHSTIELPEYHLYFGEENQFQMKKEQEAANDFLRTATHVASY